MLNDPSNSLPAGNFRIVELPADRHQELMEKMKAQFEDLQKKLGAIQSPSTGVPGKELPTKDMPADILKKKF